MFLTPLRARACAGHSGCAVQEHLCRDQGADHPVQPAGRRGADLSCPTPACRSASFRSTPSSGSIAVLLNTLGRDAAEHDLYLQRLPQHRRARPEILPASRHLCDAADGRPHRAAGRRSDPAAPADEEFGDGGNRHQGLRAGDRAGGQTRFACRNSSPRALRHVESSGEFGDTVCYVYDLAPVFARWRAARRIVVAPDEPLAFEAMECDLPVPPAVAWAYLTDLDKKIRWQQGSTP